jgi:hypothetical protein
MSLNPSLIERLEILRAIDHRRGWSSVDEERVCPLCGRRIAGRDIVIDCDRPGHFELHCPTPGCVATMDDRSDPTEAPSHPDPKSATVIRTVEMDFSNWQ